MKPLAVAPSLDEAMVLRFVQSSRPARVLARILAVLGIVTLLALVFVPWNQTSVAQGAVIARSPGDRRQLIDAPIDGRIARWHVQDGAYVKEGDALVDLADNDRDFDERLAEEEAAALARIEAVRARAGAVEARIASLQVSRQNAVGGAGQRVGMAGERRSAAEEAVRAADAVVDAAASQRDRQLALADRGLASTRTAELAEMEHIRAIAEAERARASLRAAELEEVAARADQGKTSFDATAGLEDARAALAAIRAEEAVARTELARIEVRLARQARRLVVAPRSGLVQRAMGGVDGEQIKAGDPLLWLVPDVRDYAVELFVNGNDVPLIHEGRRVRLQFEGWPAVQWSGWPSVAVGTFGGEVAVVDTAADDQGRFRVLIVRGPGDEWPAAPQVRQGARVNGWVLLDEVRLGWELWRLFNGFPPSSTAPPGKTPTAAKETQK